MRATMGFDVDAGTRAERIRRGRAVRSSRSLAARKRAPLRPGLAPAVLSGWRSGLATAGSFADQKMVSRHPGDCPSGQGFSLFINTLKFNRSETILAFG